ncbi:MAG: mechanosensitive ion channel, partial [Elusimicrobiaceae bacterium]|nr:mechanosensitive ion channel [Elusimicrobiaceae bacterium]
MEFILSYVQQIPGFPAQYHILTAQIISSIVFVLLLYALVRAFTFVCNNYLSRLVKFFKAETWFKALTEKKFFTALGIVIAAMAAIDFHPIFISEKIDWITTLMEKLTGAFVLLSLAYLINTILNTLDKLYGRNPKVPIKGLVQVFKIVLFLVTTLFLISLLLGRKPLYIITGLSALAAVFSLIFKDPILGFAASIQLTMNNLIKIGDWITVDSAGADGNILDISLTSVRVQNFDMTIVSV